jgi:hypothetical protein
MNNDSRVIELSETFERAALTRVPLLTRPPTMTPRLHACTLSLLLLFAPTLALAQDGEPNMTSAEEEEPEQMPEQPVQPVPPAQPQLTPEEIAAQREAQLRQYMQAQLEQAYGAKQRAPQQDSRLNSYYYLVEDGAKGPQLDANKPVMCYYREGSPIVVRVQCDLNTRACLVAESGVFYDPTGSPASNGAPEDTSSELGHAPGTIKTTLRPSLDREPPLLRGCSSMEQAQTFKMLGDSGFTLTAALLDVPYGYKRDARGRSFQTHFDLRSRMLLGVYYAGDGLLDEYGSGLTVDTRSTYESWSPYERNRHRFRFIEGRISMMPIEAEATVFEYDYGTTGEEPAFWITTLVGEPKRYDVRLSLGGGLTLGRLDSRRYNVEDSDKKTRQTFIDLAEGRLHWELLQGTFLEDYLMLRVGGGFGTRTFQNEDAGSIYFYPEVGIKSAALIGERGLLQWQLDVRARQAWETGGASWRQLTGSTSLEWVVLAISDQPISLFVQPEVHALDMPEAHIKQLDLRFMSGLRLSLFTPPPLDPTPSPTTPIAY